MFTKQTGKTTSRSKKSLKGSAGSGRAVSRLTNFLELSDEVAKAKRATAAKAPIVSAGATSLADISAIDLNTGDEQSDHARLENSPLERSLVHLAAADAARDRGEWKTAASEYTCYLDGAPNHAEIWVQLGNMLKECRATDASMAAYKTALDLGLDTSDTHLQLGHLYKVMGNREAAIESYLRSLDFFPLNLNAFAELERLGQAKRANDKIAYKSADLLRSEDLLVFDISDLVLYIGHHDNLSGIQRVQCCVLQAIFKYDLCPSEHVKFISYDTEHNSFRSVDQDQLRALLDDFALSPERRTREFDRAAARVGRLFPEEPLGAFLRPGRSTVLLLGAAWVIPDYASLIANLKRDHDVRFAILFHDFIPIYARETCDQGTAIVFKEFVDQVLPVVDLAMCNSRSTERDLHRYCRENGYVMPPSLVTLLGSSFDEFFPRSADAAELGAEASKRVPFVLFVSTIEGRKNHYFMFQIWRSLVDRGLDVPRLVCVGRIGWRAEAFLTNLLDTDYLGGRIELREDVSDATLNSLYRDCLFTVFPSMYEGWGLPIGESLGHGKLCVTGDNSSLPEVAGEFGCFIPIDDVDAAADAVAALLDDSGRLRAHEDAIAAGFTPVRWKDVAARVVDGCLSLQQAAAHANERSLVVPGTEYTLKKLPGGFDGLLGRAMLEAMQESFAAPILGRPTKAAHRLAGLLARDNNWHQAESWGCWARHERAGLQFMLDPTELAGETELVFYGAFSFLGPMIGSGIHVLAGGVSLCDERPVNSDSAVLSWPLSVEALRRQSRQTTDGKLAVDLGFEMTRVTPAMREASREIDSRELIFGLRSFVLLGAGAIPESLK